MHRITSAKSAHPKSPGAVLASFAFLSAVTVSAQLTVATQSNLQQLAAAITGPGVTISNPVITCHSLGYGEYSCSGGGMDITDGVILTSGRINDALGPNNSTGNGTWFAQNTPGDPLLDAVTGRSTRDACKFEFDIIPTGDSLRFEFTFGSEEYNEWVGSQFNDVFGFFISGPGVTGDPGAGTDHNIALVPGTSTAVTINNVNNGSNTSFYQDNTGGSQTQYDGYTVGLTADAVVQPCQSYHLKLIVADASDRKYDSGVFIERIESPTINLSTYTLSGAPDMVEACNPGWIRFDRGDPRPTSLTLQYFLQGTATNGTDYTAIGNVNPAIAKSISIPANASYVDRPVNPLFDNITEPDEYIRCILGNPNCPSMPLDTVLFYITDSVFTTLSPGGTICAGGGHQFTVTGGAIYSWTPAAGLSCTNCPNPVASPANTTTYSVLVTDGSCTRTMSRQVRVSHLALSTAITHPLCNGSTNGAINLSISSGIAPYSYSWTGPNGFTASSQDITNLAAGTYSVTVNDAACTRTQSWNVIDPATLSVSLSPSILPFGQNIACNGGSTGSINGIISGGTPPYTIAWTGPGGFAASSPNISSLIAGTYTVNITDVQGCSTTASTTLTESPTISFSAGTTADVLCFGSNIGAASSAVSGGIPPYGYSWNSSPAQTTANASGLAPGGYTVTLTDSYNCTATANVTIDGPAAALSTTLIAQTNVLCSGNSTGTASISISGGTAPYSTSWNTAPAQSGTSAINLPTGTWTATVTDANGCTTTRNATITQPASAINASLFAQTNVLCTSYSTGSATVSVSGGSGPYTYQWNTSPAQNTATANNLAAGNYTCTVRDVNLCATMVSVTITQPAAALIANISGQTNVLCFGNSTGSATVNVSGGTGPYSYNWNSSPAQVTATASNLPAGTFTCTITDANGCTTTRNTTITQPVAAMSASMSAQTNVLCFGNSTGTATVSGTGGTGTKSYSWNTPPVQNSATATGLAAGSYICTITDANGCTIQRNVTITQPAASLSVSLTGVGSVIHCQGNGNQNGTATAVSSGGTGPYSYSWNTLPAVQTTASAIFNVGGNYTVTATDANGCTAQTSLLIDQPGTTSDGIVSQTNISCYGQSTGSVTVSASGGSNIQSIWWNSNPVQSSSTLTNVPAGTYVAVIQHADGCVNTVVASITQPPAPLSTVASPWVNVACFGTSTGSTMALPAGGTPPYSFSWNTSPAQATAAISNLPAGSYTCTITDAKGCITAATANITQPASALSAVLGGQTNANCFGGSTGSATVNASGGTGTISYSWNTTPVQTTATATGLAAGNYTCTVKDANNCTVTVNATITQPAAALSATISAVTNVLCFNNNTGSATVSVSGGTPAYTYSWNTSPVQTGATSSNLPAGSWTCTVTDANGCATTTSATITQPGTAIAIVGNVTPAICGGAANGAVDASVSGGTGAYAYAWSGPGGFTANSQDIGMVASGAYTLTVTDANGCNATSTFNVNQPGLFSVSGTTATYTGGWNVSCAGGTNGYIDMTVSGGTTPYTHAWTGPNGYTSASLDINGLQAGSYTYVLTDANGCGVSAAFTLTQPTPVTFTTNSTQVITCNGDANGAVSVTGSGGTAPIGHAWTGPSGFTSSSSSISGLQPGTYTLVVSDANGCDDGALNTWTFANPAVLSPNASAMSMVGCSGGSNGTATANVSGGIAPYTISWNTMPVQTGATATGLAAGMYTVTVTDTRGCVRTQNVTITQPVAPLSASITAQTNVLIFGQSSGSATVTAAGGTSPFTYLWNNGQTSATASGLAAGTYSVTVTDANGCTASASVTISQPGTALSTTISAQTDVLCFGNSTGSAAVLASGGVGPYTYSWNSSPVQTSATASGLPAGAHTCTITDANGASASVSTTITQPLAALNTSLSSQINVDCFGNATGSVSVNANGGAPLYGFNWNTTPLQTGPTATGLPAGIYICTITDANGCSTNVNATIIEPAGALSASIIAQTSVDCFGNSTGSATASANAGTAPYGYSWNTSPSQTSAIATGLAAGTHTCTLTDANGCITMIDATIVQPAAALSASIGAVTQATCGTDNGGATATANGGTAPYTYAWNSSPVQTGASLTNTGAGNHTVAVTDANGCSTNEGVAITSPSGLAITLLGTTAQTCFGTANGQATVAASGGSTPYTLTWNTVPAQSGATASGLIAGNYVATVTDADGCNTSINATIDGPGAPLDLTIDNTTDVPCFNGSTGSATASASGGLAPYTILWSTTPEQGGVTANGLDAGTYIATATDAFGCNSSIAVTIQQPMAPIDGYVDASQDVSCSGGNDGFATIEAIGGSGDYSIEWNTTPVQTGATATGLSAGFWFATILDNNGCAVPKLVPVTINGPGAQLAIGSTTSDFNGFNIGCANAADGGIDVNTTGGTPGYSFAWTGPNGFTANTEDISGLQSGTYAVLATDANGCAQNLSFQLTAPVALDATAIITTAACNGASNGAVDATVTGGVAPYAYAWNGPGGFSASSEDISGIVAGVYDLTVSDANGCSSTFYFNVNQPGDFNVSATLSSYAGGSQLSCSASTDGSIDATITGGTPPYAFQWNGPGGFAANPEDINGLAAGTYDLTITDANGCGTLAQYTLNAPTVLFTTLTPSMYPSGGNVSCDGATDGSIAAMIGGGTPGFTIDWSGPNGFMANSEDISALAPGTYTITVSDVNGCNASQSATLSSPSQLNTSLSESQYNSGDAISCSGTSTGIIDLSISGGLAPYAVNWSGPGGYASTDIDITGLAAGTYTAVVNDAAGCDTTFIVTLTEPPPIAVNGITSDHNGYEVGCNASSDGSIDLNVSGGAGNFIYQWTGPNAFVSNNEDISALGAGVYNVIVNDLNGCETILDFTLDAPPPIVTSAAITTAACQGVNNGAVDLTITGGVPPYGALWNGPGGFTANTDDLSSLFASIYDVTITDANGCALSQSFDVNEPGLFTISATRTVYPGGYGVSCNGASDGAIDVTAGGGTPPLFFAWQGPNGYSAITEDISGSPAGTYDLTITDANGCGHLESWTITSPTPINIGLAASQFPDGSNVACANGGDGSIDATIIGGVAPYAISWSGPSGQLGISEDLTGLTSGMYTVNVVDAIGCSASASITLTEPVPISLVTTTSFYISGGNVSCTGESDGSIGLSISGGSLLYFIHWTGPNGFVSNNEDISGLEAGTYNVTVMDANGCTTNASTTLIAPNPIIIDLAVAQYSGGYTIGCNGTSGDVEASVQGGAVPWTYAWTGPNGFTSNAQDLNDVSAGTYDLLVTDAAGCTATASVTLTEPTPIDVTAIVSTVGNGYEVGCAGNDGSIDLSVSGGNGPYIIDWNGTDGFASLNEDLSGLDAGTYDVTITDVNGCISQMTFILEQASTLTTSVAITGNVCDGLDDGGIDLSVSGGVAPWGTMWSGPNGFASSNEDINGLAAGTYTVDIIDANGCSAQQSAIITANSPIDLNVYVSDYGDVNIPCSGANTGVIEATISGGAGSLDVLWSGPNGFTSIDAFLSGLVAGDYLLSITDDNGCSRDTSITLIGPGAPIIASISAAIQPGGNNVSCSGGSDGSIDLTVSGGSAPYDITWHGPAGASYSAEDPTGLTAGHYDVVITDVHGCSFTDSINLTGPDSALIASIDLSQYNGGFNTSCHGNNDGSISVSAAGGNGSYLFSWSGPGGFTSSADSIGGLQEGIYTLTLIDLNGCTLTEDVNVVEPEPINWELIAANFPSGTNISCHGMNDGAISASVDGGSGTYEATWTGPDGFTAASLDITELYAGEYCITIIDGNGCTASDCITLGEPEALDVTATSSAAGCGQSTGSVDASISGGTAPYSYSWSNGAFTEDITGVPANNYWVIVSDMNGCDDSTMAQVAGGSAISGQAIVNDVLCHGDLNGGIDLTMTSGTAPYSFAWTGGTNDEDLSGLQAGSYQVQVTDAGGCTWTEVFTVQEPEIITSESTLLSHGNGFHVSASGAHDGGIAVEATGGTAPCTYLWSNGASTSSLEGLAVGTYGLTITDANGCVRVLEFILTGPDGVELPTGFTPNGDGHNDLFVIHGLEKHPENQLLVFNRWGNVVYDRLNYKNDWGGENLEGEYLPNGTYFIILRLGSDAMNLQGYVDLRR